MGWTKGIEHKERRKPSVSAAELAADRKALLEELESAYLNMESILEQSAREKEIAYGELQSKFQALEKLYGELSNKENMLIHLEKLSSIGQFITEIIHELSNPLTAISGHVELAMMMKPNTQVQRYLSVMLNDVRRMQNYLVRFREMAYKGEEDFREVDINDNLVQALTTIDILKPRSIKLSANLCKQPLKVKGDPYQLHQIYLNLAKNAFDAMKKQGNLLAVSTRSISAAWIKTSGEVGEHYCQNKKAWQDRLGMSPQFALVEVRDNGSGIPPEKIANIFKAFFTTKPRGEGTGLGLSIASDIAMRHGGNLAVKSTPGEGTVFQLLIPLTE